MNMPRSKKHNGCRNPSLVDAAEVSFWLSELFSNIYSPKESQSSTLPLKFYIDSKQLHEALFSLLCPVLDKKLKVEVSFVR